MIHTACAQEWIIHTDGYARSQYRIEYGGALTSRDLADVKADAIPVNGMGSQGRLLL
jgi:hypothetical protein